MNRPVLLAISSLIVIACGSSQPPPDMAPPAAPSPSASTVNDERAKRLADQADQMQMTLLGNLADGGGVDAGAPAATTHSPSASVSFGTLDASGGTIDHDVIERTMAGVRPRFRACYQAGLKVDPALKGTAALHYVIDPSGTVSSPLLANMPPAVASCVSAALERLLFPSPTGGPVSVNYSVVFDVTN